jgi:sulfur relay (sulfurtransferase) complex TusBCD TusD component (DsrE family)
MALSFGMKQLDLGHPLTVFLNDKGVYVGSTANAGKYAEQQQAIATLLEKGAVVYSCPMCMQHYGVNEADLLPGILVSNPDAIGKALFMEGTKTLTW